MSDHHIPTGEDLRSQTLSKSDGLQILAVLSNLINFVEANDAKGENARESLINHVKQIQRRLMGK